MPVIAGAAYAVGKVFIQHFASGGTFLTFDPEKVRAHYAGRAKISPLITCFFDKLIEYSLILNIFIPTDKISRISDYNGFRGGPQSDIPHKAAKNTETLFFFVISVPLCGIIKKSRTKPQRTRRLCFLCDLCASVRDHKKKSDHI